MILPRRLRVASLLILVLLIAGPIAAVPHRPHEAWPPGFSAAGLLSEAWMLVSRILRQAGRSNDPIRKAGSQTDPFGNPTPNTQPPSDSATAVIPPASGN
jgi:hypothetical protein